MDLRDTNITKEQYAALAAEVHKKYPADWVKNKTGGYLWSKQVEILESVRDNKYTAVHSCHGSGKSFLAGNAVAWWVDVHPTEYTTVITSAPTVRQVKNILWKEIARAKAKAGMDGRTNQTEWFIDYVENGTLVEHKVAFGQKPSDDSPDAFVGIHNLYQLVVFDEAGGMPPGLWDAADNLLTNSDSHILAIGNPDDPDSEFANVCKPGSGWNVIHISAYDTPNFTGEYVPEMVSKLLVTREWAENKIKKWGIDNPLTVSKVFGKFPATSNAGLIPSAWVIAAQNRDLGPALDNKTTWDTGDETYPKSENVSNPLQKTPVICQESNILNHLQNVKHSVGGLCYTIEDNRLSDIRYQLAPNPHLTSILGVDVGGGTDKSVVAHRVGGQVRIIRSDHNPDTAVLLGATIEISRNVHPEDIRVDNIGIGKGMCDIALQYDRDPTKPSVNLNLTPVNVGTATFTSPDDSLSFLNLRAAGYWNLREQFRLGTIDIDPDDDELASQLVDIQFERTSQGKIKIESKKDMKKRGKHSPDETDAVMLTFLDLSKRKRTRSTWGRRRGT